MLIQDIFLTNPRQQISSSLQSETADGCVSDLNAKRLVMVCVSYQDTECATRAAGTRQFQSNITVTEKLWSFAVSYKRRRYGKNK